MEKQIDWKWDRQYPIYEVTKDNVRKIKCIKTFIDKYWVRAYFKMEGIDGLYCAGGNIDFYRGNEDKKKTEKMLAEMMDEYLWLIVETGFLVNIPPESVKEHIKEAE